MKKAYKILLIGMLLSASNLFAKCCCEDTIAMKTKEIDAELKAKNKANESAVSSLNNKIKDLNDNILINRTKQIADGNLQAEMNKFNIVPKNLYHASSLPMGVAYLQMAKNEFEKEALMDTISNQTDAVLLNSKTNLESLKNSIYSTSEKVLKQREEDTTEVFKVPSN